ncbi:MAG TPA: hypothetical protein VHM64_03125 [Candidatus Binatia bacterium]|nr:hypothetical protein [Candidatus Binatia bacterium]
MAPKTCHNEECGTNRHVANGRQLGLGADEYLMVPFTKEMSVDKLV